MKYVKLYENYVNWKQGGIVFILGKPNSTGKRGLFIGKVKNLVEQKRTGQPVQMATLFSDLYRVRNINGELIGRSIMYDDQSLENMIGLRSLNVGMNKTKTPFWSDTISQMSIPKVIKTFSEEINKMTDLDL
jgi:hypothetical protein